MPTEALQEQSVQEQFHFHSPGMYRQQNRYLKNPLPSRQARQQEHCNPYPQLIHCREYGQHHNRLKVRYALLL